MNRVLVCTNPWSRACFAMLRACITCLVYCGRLLTKHVFWANGVVRKVDHNVVVVTIQYDCNDLGRADLVPRNFLTIQHCNESACLKPLPLNSFKAVCKRARVFS